MTATEKQAWLDGLKVGDRVYCEYGDINSTRAFSKSAILPIVKITPKQFVTAGDGVRFNRTGGKLIGGYWGSVQPLTLAIVARVTEEKEHRKLRYWFTELKANDLTTEQLTAMKKAYEGVTK